MSARRRRTYLPIAATMIVLAGSAIGACGDSDNSNLLSPTSASQLRSTLAQIEQTIENGDCAAAQEQVSLLEQQVSSLDRVEADLKDALESGATRLQQLVVEECQSATAETPTGPPAGTTDTGGATGPDEEQTDEPGKGKGKKKGKDKGGGQDDEGGGDEDSGGSTGGGTTGSGGFAP